VVKVHRAVAALARTTENLYVVNKIRVCHIKN
jgi:hypothetical protein